MRLTRRAGRHLQAVGHAQPTIRGAQRHEDVLYVSRARFARRRPCRRLRPACPSGLRPLGRRTRPGILEFPRFSGYLKACVRELRKVGVHAEDSARISR
jgi:hypothetical protein